MIDKNDIPKSWESAQLDELIKFYIGGDWGKDISLNDSDFDLAYCIRGSEIRKWKEEKGRTASIRKVKKSSIETRKLFEGDILVEISGGGPEQPVGRTVLIDKAVLSFEPSIIKICTNFLRLIRPFAEIDSRYLSYYLDFFYHTKDIASYQGGSNNLRNLKFPDYLTIEIPIPPFNEQPRIVEKIEELLTELDKGVEQLESAQKQLEIYKQSIIKWAFEGRLIHKEISKGELPKGWELLKLKDLVQDKIGLRRGPFGSAIKKEFFVPNGYKVYEQSNAIKNDCYIGKYFIDENKYQELINFKVVPDDLIVSCSGSLGRITEIPKDAKAGIINQALLRIRLKKNLISNKLFMFQFRSALFQKKIFEQSQGTAMANLVGIKDFKEIEMTVPPFKEQGIFIQEIENRLSVCDKIEETIETALKQSEILRYSILKKAFEGKLVKQNPKDEPAQKLLERIRAEKKNGTEVKSGKKKVVA